MIAVSTFQLNISYGHCIQTISKRYRQIIPLSEQKNTSNNGNDTYSSESKPEKLWAVKAKQ